MKVIVSGGGTGGHIYPAIAICQKLQERHEDVDILYIGTDFGPEKAIVEKHGYKFRPIESMGMPRKISKKLFKSFFKNIKGLKQAKKIIKEYKPDIVIGTGGYVCGPILYRAFKKKIPTLIHESNSYPGLTTRLLSTKVNYVLISYAQAMTHLKNKDNVIVTGNPVRNNFSNKYTESDLEKLGIKKDRPVVFSFGGSNGSYWMNKAVSNMAEHLDGKFYLLHQTGNRYYEKFMEDTPKNDYLKVFPYIDNIDLFYAVSDLIIASSGAMTLAELSSVKKPSILIPKNYTTENHQQFNAETYVDNGASLMILEKDLNEYSLYDNILDIVKDEDRMKLMGENAGKLANPNAADQIVDIIDRLTANK
ncbi:MAG: undecaprenyldiphospho-muramoylpentapeptide beta-N-acetylglucosaminyltransferase [Peptoniphilaceae bacterium]|nr:undecaprenyldiphospho-muramoylpentapeptide beta-N-acetylglucosaminyltransferase [Peptoniphilaceae bacterium]MDY6018142.1 undecaprenyldiphospho-muramoylpentapeptide beta-N-acetylglucosaminyltransferase [Anaerococcus sp.]